MKFRLVAEALAHLETITQRRELTARLAHLLRQTPTSLLAILVYLMQGKIAPDYQGLDLNMGEKLAARALLEATDLSPEALRATVRTVGDVGRAASRLLATAPARKSRPLSVAEVACTLREIATISGPGSVVGRIERLARLLRRASPTEADVLLRMVTGRLRLGVADQTLLQALAAAFQVSRPELERAYNVTSDLGWVAERAATGDRAALAYVRVQVGRPVRPMLAERLKDAGEILAKMGGRCAAEYKLDGERVQAHKQHDQIILFSRRLEPITPQFPDLVDTLREAIAGDAIVELEAVPVDPVTGEIRPFQNLLVRKRKHRIGAAAKEVPVVARCFDLLYHRGTDYTTAPYPTRRQALSQMVQVGPSIDLVPQRLVTSVAELLAFFEQAVADGCEGVMCKALGAESVYQAGKRGFQWVKFKRDYQASLADSLDLVVVGAFFGRGRRAGRYGSLLMAAYQAERDQFETVCKVGAGFSDADLAMLTKRLEPLRLPLPHARVSARLTPEVWLTPELVLEVVGAELTLSPLHTCAWGMIAPERGLALRFPRFTGRYRYDKAPEDATTTAEVLSYYQQQARSRKGTQQTG